MTLQEQTILALKGSLDAGIPPTWGLAQSMTSLMPGSLGQGTTQSAEITVTARISLDGTTATLTDQRVSVKSIRAGAAGQSTSSNTIRLADVNIPV